MVTGQAIATAIATHLRAHVPDVHILDQPSDTVPLPSVLVWEDTRSWISDGVRFGMLVWDYQLRIVVPRTPDAEHALERILTACANALTADELPEPVGNRLELLDAERQIFTVAGADMPGRILNLRITA